MSVSERIVEEWKALLFRDRRLFLIFIFLPLLYIFLFGSLYSYEKVRYIPTVYIDEDRSQVSQQIIQAFSSSETFQLLGQVESEEELMKRVQTGDAYVGIIIPEKFSEKIKQGKQAELMAVIDGSNMIIASSALNNANEVVQTISGGISVNRLQAEGLAPDNAMGLRLGNRVLFNPGFSYSIYLPMGLLGTLLQSITMMSITLCMAREKEEGMWSACLLEWKTPWNFFYAKALPSFLIGLLNVVTTTSILKNIYHIPFLGDFKYMALLSALFVISLLGIGVLASLFLKNKVQATQFTVLILYPSFFLSGFSWPFSAMPDWMNTLGHLLPATYFLHGIRELAIKGNGWEPIATDLQGLSLIALATFLLAMLLFALQGFRYTRRHSEKHEAAVSGETSF